MVRIGSKLRRMHLLEGLDDATLAVTYPAAGSNEVEKPTRTGDLVYINETQYFAGVSNVAWNFYIGGYQPAQKWLKDRKGRTLDYEDIQHYRHLCHALERTHELVQQIDKQEHTDQP